MVGNPYPFTVNWFDLVADNALFEVLPVIFFFDSSMNNGNGGYKINYGTHIPNLPEQILHDGLIEPFQGFWMRARADAPFGTVTFREQYEADATGTLFNETEPNSDIPIVFTVTSEIGSETAALIPSELPIRAERPLLLSPEVISFGFPAENNNLLAAHELLIEYNVDFEIPLSFASIHEGLFEINFYGGFETDEYEIILSDFHTGEEIILKPGSGYQFYNTPQDQNAELHDDLTDQPLKNRLLNGKLANLQSETRFQIRITKLSDTSVPVQSELPVKFELFQNYPNPFNPTTNITFAVPESGDVRIDVFNIMGQRVATLVNEKKQAGYHTVTFDAARMASGTYLYRLQAGKTTITNKMLLIK